MIDSEPEKSEKDTHMPSPGSHVVDVGFETEDGLSIAEILSKREARTKRKNESSKGIVEDFTETSDETPSEDADNSSDKDTTPKVDQAIDDSTEDEVPMYESDPDDRVYHN